MRRPAVEAERPSADAEAAGTHPPPPPTLFPPSTAVAAASAETAALCTCRWDLDPKPWTPSPVHLSWDPRPWTPQP